MYNRYPMQIHNIAVIGMGRLGLCFAAILAEKGFAVTGVDLDAKLAAKINAGIAPVDEPGLQEILTGLRGRLRVTTDCAEAVAGAEMTVIFTGTPQDAAGVMSSAHVVAAARSIGTALASKKGLTW